MWASAKPSESPEVLWKAAGLLLSFAEARKGSCCLPASLLNQF